MKPIGMARDFFGLAPFLKHQRRDAFQLGMLLRREPFGTPFPSNETVRYASHTA